jgi:MFS family permease
VWGGTVGSVIGPWLVPIAGAMAVGVGLPSLAGPYLVPVVFVGLAGLLSFAFLRPDPYELADATADEVAASVAESTDEALSAILRRPGIVAALVALVVSQLVMTLIMTMTPLHMTESGHDLAAVGMVLSGHTLGMYAFSPVSGWLTDRLGRLPTILLGTTVLALSAAMAAAAPPDGGGLLMLALFLLGLGWSFGYVAGSALLSDHLALHERTRVQGVADALIWSAAAVASLGSGFVVVAAGYTALGILGVGLVAIAVVVVHHNRAAVAGTTAA